MHAHLDEVVRYRQQLQVFLRQPSGTDLLSRHIVLFHHQHTQIASRQVLGTKKTGRAGTDDQHIIFFHTGLLITVPKNINISFCRGKTDCILLTLF